MASYLRLFGSLSRGQQGDKSDIDILLDWIDQPLGEVMAELENFARHANRDLDVFLDSNPAGEVPALGFVAAESRWYLNWRRVEDEEQDFFEDLVMTTLPDLALRLNIPSPSPEIPPKPSPLTVITDWEEYDSVIPLAATCLEDLEALCSPTDIALYHDAQTNQLFADPLAFMPHLLLPLTLISDLLDAPLYARTAEEIRLHLPNQPGWTVASPFLPFPENLSEELLPIHLRSLGISEAAFVTKFNSAPVSPPPRTLI